MVDLSKRVQKPFVKALDFGDGPEEYTFSYLTVPEQARLASLSDDKKAEEIIFRLAKTVDPNITKEQAVSLDYEIVKRLMDVFSEMHGDLEEVDGS